MNNNRLIITILVLIIALGGVGWFLSSKGMLSFSSGATSNSKDQKASDWSAIFLTNGQVYFGKLNNMNAQYLNLKEIYYLQVAQSPQSGTQTTEQQQQQQTQVSLVKLGNELHGPVDEMEINRDQVLFIERMKGDAKVVEAIENYVKNGPSTPQPTASAAPATSPSPKK